MKRLAVLFCLTVLLSGQTEDPLPFFSLTSSRTYAPGEKPFVELAAVDVADLDFRVYRIHDPLKFFREIPDPHQFGGQTPTPARTPTLLERFHHLKASWHTQMRWTIREQFTDEAWATLRTLKLRNGANERESNVTNFAAAPVLNPQQLVATWRQHVKSQGRWRSQSIPVDLKEKGVYLVEAVRGDLRAYTILFVSDLGLITKVTHGRLVAFTADRKSGEPIPNVPVHLAGKATNTDAHGLADIAFTSSSTNEDAEPLVIASNGSDFAATGISTYWMRGPSANITGYAYTDRPVYRPGHPVHFKFILRTREGNTYQIPHLENVNVEVQGPEDKILYRKVLPLSSMGTGSGDLVLPKDAALGYYSVQIKAGISSTQASFEVQEYKKPEYEVRVTPVKPRTLQGDTVTATIDSRYFFGEPVANAKVTWAIHRSPYWYPIWGADFADETDSEPDAEQNNNPDYDQGGDQVGDQEGKLDANGQLKIEIPTKFDPKITGDFRYRVEARVTDAGNREITGTAGVIATYGSFLINVEPADYVAAAGAASKFKLLATDYDGKPVVTKIDLELLTASRKSPKSLATSSATTGSDGKAEATFTIPAAGSFLVRATAHTPENRTVQSTTYVWATGSGPSVFGDRTGAIQIVPDKRSYQPGDTAKILVITGVPNAKVLFSREGRVLSDVRVIDATGPSFTVEIPVHGDEEPNFFVSAVFFKDNKLYQAAKSIRVPPKDKQLAVAVTSSKPQYQPGESAKFSIEAKDNNGKPVAGEFSVGIVDEAVYGVRPDTTPSILNTFYGTSYNAVNTASSLVYYFHGEAGKKRMLLAELSANRHALAQLKPDRLVQPKVRKEFPDTALWLPAIKTGADGRGSLTVNFPDSITTWRTTARGITADSKVGSAVQKTVVRKNVILRLVTPRFFTQNDEVTISTVVHNYLATDKKARVSLDVKGLDLIDGATRDVALPSRGEVKIDWRVRASQIGDAVITGKALTDEESDAVEMTLPVEPQGVKITTSKSGSNGGTFAYPFPAEVIPVTRQLEISISPSLAGALFSAIDYLTEFPYGCTEQTLSSFVPNIVVSKAVADLGVKSDVNQPALQQKIRAGLDRLYDFQHEDGGWGWWKTDESSVFMTTDVVASLSQAKSAGVGIKPEVVANGVKWLKAAYAREPRMIPDLKAYSVFALALAGDNSQLEDAWKQHSGMTAYGKALMGLAFEAFKDTRAAGVAADLETSAKSNEAEAWWPNERDTLMDLYTDTSSETTAFAMKLLVHEKPQSPLLPKAAIYLMNHRREGFYWYSTKQTAMVIYGLTDYLKATGELKPNLNASVTVNGKQVLVKKFQPADAVSIEETKVTIPAEPANNIQVESSGEGRLYWSVKQTYYSTDRKSLKLGNANLNILRDYFKLTPGRDGEKIVYNLDALQGPLAVGDTLAVRITVTGSEWKYLLMEDPIPAGTEFIERDDLYELKTQPNWWNSYFSRREFHDDRAAIFQTFFDAGQKQYFYLLKVVNPGSFRVSPARVQPMYQPDMLSTTENQAVEIKQ